MYAPTARPIDAADRIASIDVLRGVAVLGILLMNIGSFAMPEAAYWNPRAFGDLTGANALVQQGTHVLASGKFISIFAMLFGVGIVLQARRGQTPARHRRRMLALAVIGLLHAYLLWHGDILVTYAILGLLAFRFRDSKPRVLLLIALCLYAGGLGYDGWNALSAHRGSPLEQTQWRDALSLAAADIDGEVAAFRGSWLAQMPLRAERAFSGETYVLWGFSLPFVGGMMLLGMELTHSGFFDSAWPRARYAAVAVVGCAIGWPLAAMQLFLTARWGDNPILTMLAWPLFNTLAMPFVAIGYAAAVQFFVGTAHPPVGWLYPLAAVGRTALSCYLLETILCSSIFYGHGLGWFGKVDRLGQFGVVIGVWLVLLTLAPFWLRRFQFGPMEWIWRRATYGNA